MMNQWEESLQPYRVVRLAGGLNWKSFLPGWLGGQSRTVELDTDSPAHEVDVGDIMEEPQTPQEPIDPMVYTPHENISLHDHLGSKHGAMKLLMDIYGDKYDYNTVATGFGVFPGAKVLVEHKGQFKTDEFFVYSTGKGASSNMRVAPGRGVYISWMGIDKDSPLKGRGMELVQKQFAALAQMGQDNVTLMAIGGPGKQHTGYDFWFRAGFTPIISDHEWARIQGAWNYKGWQLQDFAQKFPGFTDWWKKNGVSWAGKFDLTPGSKNWQAMAFHLNRAKSRK